MDNRIKQSLAKAMKYKNNPEPEVKKPVDIKLDLTKTKKPMVNIASLNSEPKEETISQERLQEAVIWAEILGKPVSKRRKRRL